LEEVLLSTTEQEMKDKVHTDSDRPET